jgi:LmbE family N-acetylglucosaminyl deacetylase
VLERTSTRFLRRIHRVTHRMPIALRQIEKKRVLVVSPHPDDEALAIGGCLALHRKMGSSITIAFVAMDAPTDSGRQPRKAETNESSKLLGFDYRFFEVPDGIVSRREDYVAEKLVELIRETNPDVIYSPFPGDHHRDHQAVAACTSVAVAQSGFRGEIWCYEVWSNLWPNCGVDISGVVEDKRSAIQCYESQLDENMPYVEAVLGLNRYRGLKLQVPYAEGLFVCNPSTFRDLCRSLSII